MHETDMFVMANQLFEKYVTLIHDDQWGKIVPTTPEWTIRQLVDHVARNNYALIEAITDKPLASEKDILGDEPIESWSKIAQTAEDAAENIEDSYKAVEGPLGETMTLSQLLKLQVVDRTIHAWDLSKALDIDDEIDAELVESAYVYAQTFAPAVREAGAFGEEIGVAGDPPSLQKLLALSGREEY